MPLETQDVYTRIAYKARHEIHNLDAEERDKLEDLLIDNFSSTVTKINDEALLQFGMDKGLIL